jgi:tetratricopeptide (TPR) repeat protein
MFLVFLAITFTFSCGGGSKLKETPPHLTNGMQALQKGNAAYQRGCFRRSLDYYLKAHESFTLSDQQNGVAMSLNNIGNVYRFIGDTASARLFFDQAIEIYIRLDDASGAQQALVNKAALLADVDELEDAQAILSQVDALGKNRKATASLWNTKGVIWMKQGDYIRAEEALRQGLARVTEDDPASEATLNFSLGRVMIASGRLDLATAYFEKALVVDRQLGFHRGIADDLAALGELYQRQSQHTTAAAYFQRSIKIYALIGDKKRVEMTLQQLRAAAAEAELDIRVTDLFVERWLEGKVMEIPCK